jgi:hypothetical protein
MFFYLAKLSVFSFIFLTFFAAQAIETPAQTSPFAENSWGKGEKGKEATFFIYAPSEDFFLSEKDLPVTEEFFDRGNLPFELPTIPSPERRFESRGYIIRNH